MQGRNIKDEQWGLVALFLDAFYEKSGSASGQNLLSGLQWQIVATHRPLCQDQQHLRMLGNKICLPPVIKHHLKKGWWIVKK